MIKTNLIMINIWWILLPYINLYSKTSWKFYQQLAKLGLFSSGENEQVPDLIMRKGKFD